MERHGFVSSSDTTGCHQCGQIGAIAGAFDKIMAEHLAFRPQPREAEILDHLVPAVNEAVSKMTLYYEQEDWERANLYACLAMGRLQYLAELMARMDFESSRKFYLPK